MTVKLAVTGEAVDDDGLMASLVLDENGMLCVQHAAVNTIVAQLVRAINAAYEQVGSVFTETDQLAESVQALEQHIASFDARVRECEDTCQEVRLQLGTMSSGPTAQSPVDRPESREQDASSQAMVALLEQIAGMADRIETAERIHRSDTDKLTTKIDQCDEVLRRHQDFFDDELDGRLTQGDDDRVAIKAEVEALRQSLEESNSRKASKSELNDLASKIAEVGEGQTEDHQMLADARKQFVKLDGLTDLVNENKNRMQEMWRLFGRESQELREWASNGIHDLRCAVRSKMEETDALSNIGELRQEVRELAPFLSEAMSRMESGLRFKAEASEVVRLQDGLEHLERQSGRPKKLLVGTKCLACDRQVSTAGFTDQGVVSLEQNRQQEDLFHEVQRALSQSHMDVRQKSDGSGQSDILKYVAIHVGKPGKTRENGGSSMFDGRDPQDQSPGSHALIRSAPSTAPWGASPRRLQAHDSSRPATTHGSGRSPAREVPPLVRIAPRKPQPPPRVSASSYSVPVTPRDGQPRRVPPHSMRAAMGMGAPPPPPQAPPPVSQAAAQAPFFPKMQPGAGQMHQQPSATSGMQQVREVMDWERGSVSSGEDHHRGEALGRYLDGRDHSEDSRPASVAS